MYKHMAFNVLRFNLEPTAVNQKVLLVILMTSCMNNFIIIVN
jgi:hypothetical protein